VSRIIEHGNISALDLSPERLHRFVQVELRAVAREAEAEIFQGLRHQGSVVSWIIQRRDILVRRIANHQRDPLVGKRRACQAHGKQQRE
jgi:hypothetical protein